MTDQTPPPADTPPPFPSEQDLERTVYALRALPRLIHAEKLKDDESRRRIEAHAATLAAAQGTARDLEREQIRLAACTMAALGNTPETVAERLTPGHPYYSASYGDVCRAVDREMELRAAYAALHEAAQALVDAWDATGHKDNNCSAVFLNTLASLRAALQGTGPA